MPELPEVEAVAVLLRPLVAGARIKRCRVLHSICVRPPSGHGETKAALELERAVRGRTIRATERRGKYLLLNLDRGYVALHFRLSGKVIWFPSTKISGHIDLALDLSRGTLGFVDRRHLGRVQYADSLEALSGIRLLGIDPMTREFTAERLASLLSASKRPLKLFLTGQAKLAGIGNIYSNEALWHARLDPRRRANHVRAVEASRLHKAIVGVLRRALKCCLEPAPDLSDPNWWFPGIETMIRVYGREGEPCYRDHTPIRRIRQGGQSTFFCPTCQK